MSSICQPLPAIANLFGVTVLHTLAYLTYPGEKDNAPTTQYCPIVHALQYFVSEVSGQDKDRDKERVENGECRTGVFYLAPWLNQNRILRYLQSSVSVRTLEDTYTGDGKW